MCRYCRCISQPDLGKILKNTLNKKQLSQVHQIKLAEAVQQNTRKHALCNNKVNTGNKLPVEMMEVQRIKKQIYVKTKQN